MIVTRQPAVESGLPEFAGDRDGPERACYPDRAPAGAGTPDNFALSR